VGPIIGLDDVERRKILSLLRREILPLGHPARSQLLSRLLADVKASEMKGMTCINAVSEIRMPPHFRNYGQNFETNFCELKNSIRMLLNVRTSNALPRWGQEPLVSEISRRFGQIHRVQFPNYYKPYICELFIYNSNYYSYYYLGVVLAHK
jgi:hypothetical protein